MERPVIIIGGGGHASVVYSTLSLLDADVLGYTDPSPNSFPDTGLDYLGGDDALKEYAPAEVYLAMGIGSTQDSTHRVRLYTGLRDAGFDFPPIVHPDAVVATRLPLEAGAQVMAGSIIQPGVTLGENGIVNTNASIDHDCQIGPHVHVAPGATISGDVHLGRGVHVGTGASLIQGVHIGENSVVGAGAVVIDDVNSRETVVGVPARPINTSDHD